MTPQKLTVTRLIVGLVLTVLACLSWLTVMFLGLLFSGDLWTAWLIGVAYTVVFVLFGIGFMLWKRRTRGIPT